MGVNPTPGHRTGGGTPILQVNWLVTGFSIVSLSLTITVLKRWGKLREYSKKEMGTMLVLGATGLFPYTTLYYLAFALAPAAAGNSNIINYLWPIWIVILAIPILKEGLGWKKILGIALSFAGVYLILTGGQWIRFRLEHLPAYLSAAAGAFFWGLFSVQNKRHRFEALTAMFVYSVAAFLCFAAVALLASHWFGQPREAGCCCFCSGISSTDSATCFGS